MEEEQRALPAVNDHGEPPATMALTEPGAGADLRAALDTVRVHGGCGYSTELSVGRYVDGRAALAALLAGADVFMQNLAPGAADRLGFSADQLCERHPRLICCSASGYGAGGPYDGKKAYDLLIQCETGLLSVTGTPETPCKAGISVADTAAGMYAYVGVLTALYERECTGRGSSFEVALLDALGEWIS
jgi:crotonobetainyl-CoA:carnitine CoA-transferase CaiB-like acyl-CoA transferase